MITSRFIAVSACVLTGMALLAGCGGSDEESGSSASASAPSATTSSVPSGSASVADVRGERLPAADLAPFVSDRTFSGTYEGEAFAEYYAPDGAVRGEQGGERYTGSWVVEGDQLCFTYLNSDGGPDEVDCYSVYQDGEDYLWVDADGDVSAATFEEGNPRGF